MKKRRTPSIRRQLLGWLMIPIISLCLVSAISTYLIAVGLATQAYDAALMESARELANRISLREGQPVLDLSPSALAVFKEDNVDTFFYAVIGADGHLIAGDWDILQSIKRRHERSRYQYGKVNGKAVRIACLGTNVPTASNVQVFIYVAETVLRRQALTNQIIVAVVLPQLLLIGLASLAVWLGVSRGLAPLKAARAAISKRTQWDLSPVAEVNAPVEIQPLVDAIDDLLSRLNKDIEAQRRFVANAAHQLRTPLAGLKTQTELALRQKNLEELEKVLKQIHRGAENVTRLVNQLLSLAKLEPSGAQAIAHIPVNLNIVAKEITTDIVPYALNNNIDLGFESANESSFIIGDAWSLKELITNLVDNAIRYTQPGGKVTVKIENKEQHVELSVEDNGPGIPEGERERVFERFYRVLGNNVTGSGLGLAIVQEIAQNHQAKISIANGSDMRGTLILVKFPTINLHLSAGATTNWIATPATSSAAVFAPYKPASTTFYPY